jgi:Zn finger protein HypA/HybF involved in hydrogenase expression
MEEPRGTCGRCGAGDRAPGQRWCRECRAAYERARRADPATRERIQAQTRAYYWRNAPIVRAARVAVIMARRAAKRCQECRRETRLHGHHDDYSKPLKVRWLCPRCHAATHTGDTRF